MALMLAIGLVTPLFGQPRPGGFGRGVDESQLLASKDVQTELKLTEEQVGKVEKIGKDLREKYAEQFKDAGKDKDKRTEVTKKLSEERTKALADVLKPEQTKRLKQIAVQVGGLASLQKKEVQDALKFTEKQTADLKGLTDDLDKDRGEIFKDVGKDFKKFPEAMAKVQTLNKEMTTKFLSGLSADQKKAWTELTGDEFKGKIDSGMRRRPGTDK
jgi:hypothetical protein